MTDPVALGPFDLLAPIGRGATGAVWHGRHRDQRLPVAIKLVPPAHHDPERFDRVFHNEVRQAARLDHPGIVGILDYGEVSAAEAARAGGALTAHARYLAMEFVSGGSLSHAPPRDWADARDGLLQLLDALAHAHARGVLHRDLKPANVLRAGPEDRAIGMRLTDLGIAHAWLDPEDAAPIAAGTAAFMAPEQVRGDARSQGPWTDLYALGCLGWWMATGHAPYSGRPTDAVLAAHLAGELPRFEPHLAVPAGFEAWLRQLLRRLPAERFRCAADASAVLGMLGADTAAAPRALARPRVVRSDSTLKLGEVNTLPLDFFSRIPDDLEPDTEEIEPVMLAAPATLPPWRAAQATRPPLHLAGVGLPLLGVRALPLVGRDAALDALWEALQAVHTTGRPRAVHLVGPPGAGASAVARAICERGDELGVAVALQAHHAAIPSPTDGLDRALARHLGCAGLTGDALDARLASLGTVHPGLGDAVGRDALRALLAGATTAGGRRTRRADAQGRFRPLLDALLHLAGGRPLLLLLDDAHHSGEAQAFARWLLDGGSADGPVLCLLTAPEGARLAPELSAHPDLARLPLPPLSDDALRRLLERLLPLGAAEAATAIRQAAGNPLLAIERVRQWAARGDLVPSADGYRLREGAADLPSGGGVWRARVAAAVAAVPGPVPALLALGAVLGRDIDEAEWRSAADQAGLAWAPELPDALVAAGLARLTEGGLQLLSSGLRAALLQPADAGEGLADLHRACAAALLARTPPRRDDPARAAHHLVAAGAPAAALAPLAQAIEDAFQRGALGALADLLALRGRALEATAAPARDRADHDLAWLKLLLWRGDLAAAAARAAALVEAAAAGGWRDLEARALRIDGMVAEKQGDLPRAAARFRAAHAAARAAEDLDEQAAALEHQGTVSRRTGDPAAALVALREALALNRARGATERETDCLKEIGAALVVQGQQEEAARVLREASERYAAVGYPVGRMQSLNNLGDALRAQGDLAGAEGAYQEALGLARRTGTHFALLVRANLGLVRLADGRMAEARDTLLPCLRQARETGRRGIALYLHLALLSCAADAGAWRAWDRHRAAAADLWGQLALSDPELDHLVAEAARRAAAAGQDARAAEARALGG